MGNKAPRTLAEHLAIHERLVIIQTLALQGYSRKRTAEILGRHAQLPLVSHAQALHRRPADDAREVEEKNLSLDTSFFGWCNSY